MHAHGPVVRACNAAEERLVAGGGGVVDIEKLRRGRERISNS